MMTPSPLPRHRARTGLGFAVIAALALAGCETTGTTAPAAQTAQTAPTAPAAPATDVAATKVEPPLDEHQASARCWMKYDSNSRMSLDQKAVAVDKCIDETMRAQRR